MKKLLIIILLIGSLPVFAQTGPGWKPGNTKFNQRDSSFFNKDANFNATLRVKEGSVQIGGITVSANGAELNILNGALVNTTELNYLVGATGKTGTGNLVYSASPTFTGTPTAPTAAPGTNSTQIATTEFVIANGGAGSSFAYIDSANYYNKTFNVVDKEYGAISGDGTDDADEIQKAIDDAYQLGSADTTYGIGGTVIIPPGQWNLSKALIIRSNVHIDIAKNAEIVLPDSYTGAIFTNPTDDELINAYVSGGTYTCDTQNTYQGIVINSVSGLRYVMNCRFSDMFFDHADTAISVNQLSTGWMTACKFDNITMWHCDVGVYEKGASGYPISNYFTDMQIQYGASNSTVAVKLGISAQENMFSNLFIWDWDDDVYPNPIILETGSNRNTFIGDWDGTHLDGGYYNFFMNYGHIYAPDSLMIVGHSLTKDNSSKLHIIGNTDNGTSATFAGDIGIQIKSAGTASMVYDDNSSAKISVRNQLASAKYGSQLVFQTHETANTPVGGLSDVMVLDYNGSVITPFRNTGAVSNSGGITHAQLARLMYYDEAAQTDITADPQIVCNAAYARDGTIITIMGSSDTNTLKLDDGAGLQLAGGVSFTLGLGDNITLVFCSALNTWVEISRSDN